MLLIHVGTRVLYVLPYHHGTRVPGGMAIRTTGTRNQYTYQYRRPLVRPNQFLSHSDLFEDKQLVCRVFNAFCVPCAELSTECVGELCVFATVPISKAKNVA